LAQEREVEGGNVHRPRKELVLTEEIVEKAPRFLPALKKQSLIKGKSGGTNGVTPRLQKYIATLSANRKEAKLRVKASGRGASSVSETRNLEEILPLASKEPNECREN